MFQIFRLLLVVLCIVVCVACARARRDSSGKTVLTKTEVEALNFNHSHSRAYLQQARAYRAQGRYELSRQSYVQALSICSDGPTLKVIQRELEGINLLLRTMR